jgi:hypothetical protein
MEVSYSFDSGATVLKALSGCKSIKQHVSKETNDNDKLTVMVYTSVFILI